ncbi:D-amino acid dehydrogenase [Oceanisphaera avium]|uniref:Amino acid dehydrogenase n=1 Tax=Oceanisphaera avium TaxID=1903694 RepID=A0A1Y0CUR2_9GAMM|nr:D-amino acid dehydrogenase [Oceanisphaera avium]ART79080.1 amino acid dehydrogenase [Oceanisphaera avium]
MRITIIGGGVIGLTTAYALINQGHSVELFEQETAVGLATSFANGGQLSYRYVSPLADAGVPLQALAWMFKKDAPLRFSPKLSLSQWQWCARFLWACRQGVNQRNAAHLLRLALYSQTVLHDWQTQGIGDFSWRANGKLVVYRNARHFQHAANTISQPELQQALNVNECVAVEPALKHLASQLSGGIFSPGDEVGDCQLFCQRLLAALQQSARFTLHRQHKVTDLHQEHGKVRSFSLKDDQGLMQSHAVEQLVIAAGMGSVSLLKKLRIKVPLYPLKGYSLTLPVADLSTVPDTNVTDYDRKIVYARLNNQLRVAAMVDIAGPKASPSLDTQRITRLRQFAQASFPNAGNFQHATPWAGLRPATPQGTPIIGATALDNLWLNLGHGSLGFTLACGSAQALAHLINQQTSPIALTGLQGQF